MLGRNWAAVATVRHRRREAARRPAECCRQTADAVGAPAAGDGTAVVPQATVERDALGQAVCGFWVRVVESGGSDEVVNFSVWCLDTLPWNRLLSPNGGSGD